MASTSARYYSRTFTTGFLKFLLIFGGALLQALNGVQGKKEFLSHAMLLNKVYQDPILKVSLAREEICTTYCQRINECFAYAYSDFTRICQIYKYSPGMQTRTMNSYILRIAKRSEDDGFYVYGMSYAKLFLKSLSAYDAQETCNSLMGGMLVSIQNEEQNQFLSVMMDKRKVFAAHIGLTDEEEEDNWKYYNGQSVKYNNWHFKGKWNRTDRNCAMLTAARQWTMINCYDRLPFICQIPFY